MFITQLSVFVENKQGRLEAVINTLGLNGVNISALSIAETSEFGVLRAIVDDAQKAKDALGKIGVISKITDVIAVYIDDTTGGLASVLKVVSEGGVSIEYMYAFLGRTEGKALMVLKADDEGKAQKLLTENGIKIASPDEI